MLEAWYVGHLDEPVTVTTPAELDAVLDAVAAADTRQVVQLIPDGDLTKPDLTVGLYRDRGTLRYADQDDAYYSTGGTFALPDGWDELMYYLDTGEQFYPDNAEIPATEVRAAAHYFLTHQQLPGNVTLVTESGDIRNPSVS
ncbi:Imm1 family immunity protein [Amycolatopsis sp. cmx-11-12]|uniref:Imm1 family immunity protein n=1 Tax=Amycolatopsis sp. cmx-11-12 TaxID=2785795 RepID=UPI003917F451